MPEATKQIIDEFCGYCTYLYKAWFTRRIIFDDNPRVNDLYKSNIPYFFDLLSEMSLEYTIHMVAKLHDPAVDTRGNENLSIDYIFTYGPWDEQTKNELKELIDKMDSFADLLKPVRNKILAHRDVPTILEKKALGGFEIGKDFEYFDNLQKFINIIHTKTYGSIYPLENAYPLNDARTLVAMVLNDYDELQKILTKK